VAVLLYSILVHIAILKFHGACCEVLLKIPLYIVYLPFIDPLNFYYSAVIGKDLYSTAVGMLSAAMLIRVLAALREDKVVRMLFLLITFTTFNLIAFGSWRIQFFMLNCGFLTLAVFLYWLGRRNKGALFFGASSIIIIFLQLRDNLELLSLIAYPAAVYLVPGSGTFQFPASWIGLLSSAFGPSPAEILRSSVTLYEKFYFSMRYCTFMFLFIYAWLRSSNPLINVLLFAAILFPILTAPWYMNIMVSERQLIYLKVLWITLSVIVLKCHLRDEIKSILHIRARGRAKTSNVSSEGMG